MSIANQGQRTLKNVMCIVKIEKLWWAREGGGGLKIKLSSIILHVFIDFVLNDTAIHKACENYLL